MDIPESLLESMGKLEGESWAAWKALAQYARMTEGGRGEDAGRTRNLRKLASDYHHGWRAVSKWSSKFNWVERVGLYDRAVAEWRVRMWQERRRAVDEADYLDGERMRRAAREILDQVETKLLAGEDVGPAVAAKYLESASKAQRLATGAPTERTEQTLSPETEKLLDRIYGTGSDQPKSNRE